MIGFFSDLQRNFGQNVHFFYVNFESKIEIYSYIYPIFASYYVYFCKFSICNLGFIAIEKKHIIYY